MSYVKISDPAIIDLAGVQQIVSVVNQHSDLLNVLINRFGTILTPQWDDETAQGVYDPASHNLAFGKDTIKSTDTGTTSAGKTFYKKGFDYNGVTFSKAPLIVVSLDNTAGGESTQLDIMVSVHNVTTSGFTIRAARSGFYNSKQTIDNQFQVNWIAIGPR